MKVHHLINNISLQKGGAQRLVRQFHSVLKGSEIESCVVALCGEEEAIDGAVFLDNDSPYSWRSLISVTNYIRHNCASEDIIHVHLFPALLHASIAVKILGWKGSLVCTEHNTYNRRRSHPLGKLIDQLVYPTYQRIYCISCGTHDALQSWMPQLAHKLVTIENGISLTHTAFHARSSQEKVVIASAGRLHKQKNYGAALRALAMLRQKSPAAYNRLEYRIAGVGEEESALKALSSELSLNDCVKFCGYVDNILEFYRAADIFLMPSKWEGFGLAAVEAMNTGLPVIASDVIGLKEIINVPETCGVIVSPSHPEEIADAMEKLLDSDLRKTLGQNAFNRSSDFSVEGMVSSYASDYMQLQRSAAR